ncbi:MAG TPA: hypothetical protein VFA27_07110 [Vicinamibacterales bacterium]|nr:hypothetical protein [Vicinamibacterales bacterium]
MDITIIAFVLAVLLGWVLAFGIQQVRRGQRAVGGPIVVSACILLFLLVLYVVAILFFSHGEM